MPRKRSVPALGAGLLLIPLVSNVAFAQGATTQNQPIKSPARLQLVAQFPHQVTGVTASADGRLFVNFPRWTEDSPVSVAEVTKDGRITPYPNVEWNSWRNAKKDEMAPQNHFICVQSVVADKLGNLWVLDPAAPAMGFEIAGGPKLVRIDLATNEVAQTIAFDETVAPQGSYLNDVRFSPDGAYAFITDSGVKGALVVVNLKTQEARRVLDGQPSTQPEKAVQVKADGKVLRRPDGRGIEFAADGIALSTDGATLYWQAIKGKTLYSIPTAALIDQAMPAQSLQNAVKTVGENGVADGLLIAKTGRMYITAPEENAVKIREGETVQTLVQDARLRWPDTLTEGPNGEVYVTASHIQDSAMFNPAAPAALPTQLWRIEESAERRAEHPASPSVIKK